MRGYRLGTNLARLLKNYWKRQRIVPNLGKCQGTSFETGRGVKQGDPASPIIFNNVVDAVVQVVLNVVCSTWESHNGIGWAAGDKNLVFYANDGRILGRDHEWVQYLLIVTVSMFLRMGLGANLEKTNSIVFTPGFIWGEWG